MSRFYSLCFLLLATISLNLFAASGPEGAGAPPAPTPGTAGDPAAPPQGGGQFFGLILMIGFVAFMYFVLIRPQRKEQKKREHMISELREGAKVVTIGGVHGTIVRKGEKDIGLQVADGVVLTMNVGAVHETIDESNKD
ncbi:MAG: preprotein translocase subunit YajC [Planctomycetota bacterium]